MIVPLPFHEIPWRKQPAWLTHILAPLIRSADVNRQAWISPDRLREILSVQPLSMVLPVDSVPIFTFDRHTGFHAHPAALPADS